jgi:hypothetical protein
MSRNPRRAYDKDGREFPPATMANIREQEAGPRFIQHVTWTISLFAQNRMTRLWKSHSAF